jgi:hypothetical protein
LGDHRRVAWSAIEQSQLSERRWRLHDGQNDLDAGAGHSGHAKLAFLQNEKRITRITFIPEHLAGGVAART